MSYKNNIVAFYDSRAADYDTEDPAFHNRLASDFISYIERRIRQASPENLLSHLDLCCGTGLVAFASLTRFGPGTTIHGLDISPQSLEIARSKLPSRISNVAFFLADAAASAEELPADIRLMSYDIITCCSAFVLLPAETHEDRISLVRRWRERLKPGGLVIFDVPAPGTQYITEIIDRAFSDVCGLARLGLRRDWITDKADVMKLMVGAGFRQENVEIIQPDTSYKRYEVPVDKVEASWERILNVKFYETVTKGASAEDLAKVKDFFVRELLEHEKNGMIVDECKFFITIAKVG